jgi:hypothetical protein
MFLRTVIRNYVMEQVAVNGLASVGAQVQARAPL